jgi:hypothetical protein
MAFIQDITVNIIDGTLAMARKGFGLPLILGNSNITQGSQLWLFCESKNADDSSGLTPGGEYKATIKVDGNDKEITITSVEEQKISDVINEIDNQLGDGAIASFIASENGGIRIVSNTTGTDSAIIIEDNASNGLFSSLTGNSNPENSIHGSETGVYKEYSDLSGVAEDYDETMAEYNMAQAMFSQTPSPQIIAIYSRKTGISIKETLSDVKDGHDGFYAIFIPERDLDSMAEAGEWANTEKKFFFGCTSIDNLNDINRNYDREAYIIHDNPEDKNKQDYPECAWAGQNLPKDPGSITWKWKNLNGQVVPEYSISQLNKIREKKCQAINEIGGIPVVNEGTTTSGRYIDVIRGMDWIKARIEEGLYNLFMSNDKVALDNVGIAKATTEEELKKSDDKEFMYRVTVPLREEIPEDARKERKLPNVKFIYYLAGAIHKVEVNGRITV